jgi:hypothetical protein
MAFRSSIVEKTSTLHDETVHIMFGCIMHLHGNQNKMVAFMKPFIFADINNGIKFYN